MYKATQKLTTQKGSLSGGKMLSKEEVQKVLSKREIEEQVESGKLVEIVVEAHNSPKIDKAINELVDEQDKNTLSVKELRRVATHYGIGISGTKAKLLDSIAKFEKILDTEELSTLSDDEIDAMAKYLDIDLSLSREEKESALAI